MEGFTLHKEDRLRSQKIIGEMFSSGESFLCYPLKIVFQKTEFLEKNQVQAAFTVSKRNFKRAVKRNLLKRRMREAYRLNRSGFCEVLSEKNIQLAIMFVYIAKDVSEYEIIEKAMNSALKKIIIKIF